MPPAFFSVISSRVSKENKMALEQYTFKEHKEFLEALAKVDEELPVAQNPTELYSDDELKQMLKCLSDRMEQDPSLKADADWMNMWGMIVAITDFKGIAL